MNQYFALLSIIPYSLIAIQDFRDRAISWILIPLLMGLNLLCNIWLYHLPILFLLKTFLLNILIIGVQFLLLQVYVCIRDQKFTPITQHFVGVGDLAFYLVLFITLSPLNLFFFHLISLLACLLTGILLMITGRKNKARTIPMAGIQALMLALLTINSILNTSANFFNEEWLLNKLAYVCYPIH